MAERELGLEVTSDALDYLAATGYDPVYGARPLKRAIQQYVENPLAEDILTGHYLPGETIQADVKEGHIVFSKK